MNNVEKVVLKRIKLSLNGIKKDVLYNVSGHLIKNVIYKHAMAQGIAKKIFSSNESYGEQLDKYWWWYGETIDKTIENLMNHHYIACFGFDEYYATPFSKWRYQTGFFFTSPYWSKNKIEKENYRIVCLWNDREKLRAFSNGD